VVRPPNSLQTTPARWGNLRDRWATTLRRVYHQEHAHSGKHELPVPFGHQRDQHRRVFVRSELTRPQRNFGKIIRDKGKTRTTKLQFRIPLMF